MTGIANMVVDVGRHHIDGACHFARCGRGVGVADGAQRQLVDAGRQIAGERDCIGAATGNRQTHAVPVGRIA